MSKDKIIWVKVEKGIRYREHPDCLHGKRPDRYYVIRYTSGGKKIQEALGWASDGVNLEKARLILAKVREANRLGEGPATLQEQRLQAAELKEKKKAEELEAQKRAITTEYYWETAYWPAQGHKSTGGKTAEKALWAKWIEPTLGQIPLKEITAIDLEKIKKTMLDTELSPATIKYAMAVVSQIWTMAQQDGFVNTPSPTKLIALPKKDNRRQRYLSKSEAETLLNSLFNRSKISHDMSILAMDCGLRFGEIAKLTWQDCSFESERLFIRDPKGEINRFAFMTPRVKDMLLSLYPGEAAASGLIFKTKTGTMFDRIPKPFREVANELFNQNVADKRMRVCFHTLRHTFASWLVEGGTNLYTVKELMGHSDIEMTQRYSHLSPESLKAAIKILSNAENEQHE